MAGSLGRGGLWRWVLAGVVLALGGGALAWRLGQTAAPRPIELVVSGDTAGWITPCGCTSNQSGGLPRRATYLAQRRPAAEVIYADVGGAPAGASAYQQVKFEAILRGETLMGAVAHNLGGPELALGPERLRQAARQAGAEGPGGPGGVKLISANTTDASGTPLAEPAVIVTRPGGRVALVGVVAPRYATSQVKVSPPRAAVLATVDALKGRYDTLVVLAYMPEAELEALAAELPEVDAVIGGPTGQAIKPRRSGPTVLAAATNKGKFLIRLPLGASPAAGAEIGEAVELTGVYADDAAQVENVAAYRRILAEKDFAAEETGLVKAAAVEGGGKFAGTEACLWCHEEDGSRWQKRKHAAGWKTLVDKGAQMDPYCQECHTTGYALAGGFRTIKESAERTGVGCEDCHGPSEAHAWEPTIRTPYRSKDQCLRCHDQENSPKFEYTEYWKKIEHGVKIKPKGTATARREAGR